MADLKKLLVVISESATDAFIEKYVESSSSRDTSYDDKIVFLTGTQEIFTQGYLFGVNGTDKVETIQDALDALTSLVGDLDSTDTSTIVGYLKQYAETQASNVQTNLDNYISSNDEAVAAIKETADNALPTSTYDDFIANDFAIISSYITTFIADADLTTNAIDTLKELQEYISEHGTEVTEMLNSISENTSNIETNTSYISTLFSYIESITGSGSDSITYVASYYASNALSSATEYTDNAIETLSNSTIQSISGDSYVSTSTSGTTVNIETNIDNIYNYVIENLWETIE